MSRPFQFALTLLALTGLTAAMLAGLLKGFDDSLYGFAGTGGAQFPLALFGIIPGTLLLGLLLLLYPGRRPAHTVARAALVLGLGELVEFSGKLLLPQPAGSMPEHVLGVRLAYSYPSGHMFRAVLLLGLLISVLPARLMPLLLGLLVLVAMGLVGYGEHYPSDVLAGWLLGTMGVLWLAQGEDRPRRPGGNLRQAPHPAAIEAPLRRVRPRARAQAPARRGSGRRSRP